MPCLIINFKVSGIFPISLVVKNVNYSRGTS